jgi:hypothetical protein
MSQAQGSWQGIKCSLSSWSQFPPGGRQTMNTDRCNPVAREWVSVIERNSAGETWTADAGF